MTNSPSLPSSAPSDAQLEAALRDAVRNVFTLGNFENLTVKRIRAAVEHELDLKEGYFKESDWKDRSKGLIEAEAQKNDKRNTPTRNRVSPTKVVTSRPTSQSPEKSNIIDSVERDEEEEEEGYRRPAKKRSHSRVISDDENDINPVGKASLLPEKAKQKVKSSALAGNSHAATNNDTGSMSRVLIAQTKEPVALKEADLGDSDLSEVFDEGPKPKRRKTSKTKRKPEPKQRGPSKSKESDPQAEEIKNLQGWLVKCGVRKVWGKELKPYESPREKIRHLKEMLADVGMTGRYSKEKAESIREARELAADLEAVQEGAKLWGKEVDSSDRGKRARTTRNVLSEFDYMDDGD